MGGEANGGKRDGSSLRRTAKTVNVIVKRKVELNHEPQAASFKFQIPIGKIKYIEQRTAN